ncbi:uncharacterized protein LOC130739956 [Lotus japonicus]|uniref:uncharacterized protein LOC130739956 n=1 Tax=Lotus japonicus TaxID=34305 RepID=UPI0025837630|nr:uncharacterized protein LOC130739956 [Lotus japonicus]
MLRATAFPPPFNSPPVLPRAHTCHSLAPARVVQSSPSSISRFEFRVFQQPCVKSLRAVRGGGVVTAVAKKKGRGGVGIVGVDEGFDEEEEGDGIEYYDDDDDDEEVEEGEFDDDGGDDGEEVLPLEQMKQWFDKKPKGFGEGKVYDTSVEDKLLEELRQSREAQAANLEKLKANPVKPASNKNAQNQKDAEVVPLGGRVLLANLPKKKNIHRDLKSAMQGVPGIINIAPAVTGNKKTRDPICKGFAFVDFKDKKDAVRFVELYTGQTLTFGKIQKQIKCEVVNAQSSSSSPELSKNLGALPRLMDSPFEEDSNEDSNMDDSAVSSWDGTDSNDLDEEQESDGENQEYATALDVDFDDSVEMTIDSETNPLPSEQGTINPTAEPEKKSSAKFRQESAPKKKLISKKKVKKVLEIPGSAKRLKIKEKAVLTDVFSKYGKRAVLASKDN